MAEHPELVNLAAKLNEKELAEIAAVVLDDYREDEDNRGDWLAMHKRWVELYFQRDNPKDPPWTGASSESLPMLAEACNQFSARALKAFFPNRDIIKVVPLGQVDDRSILRAERVEKHMSWQLLDRDRSYKKNKDRLLLSAAIHGSFFTKTYYDPSKGRNIIRNVRAEDLVVPYGIGPRDLEDIERKSEIVWLPVNRSRILAKSGYFVAEAEPYDFSGDDSTLRAAHDKTEGLTQPGRKSEDEFGLAKLIEQHRLLDLDEDGIGEPYIVTVDAQAEKVLRIAIRYDTDDVGSPLREKEPVEYYTHYCFLENPDGFYGLGLGHLIGSMNTSINKMLRQVIDAGTLANVGNMSGYISQALSGRKGEVGIKLGKFQAIQNSADEIGKGIYKFDFKPPNNVLPEMIQLMMGRADRLATTTEALTGQMDRVQQPTTVLALIEQGLEVFGAVYERLFNSWEQELKKIYRLNSKFLPSTEYFALLDLKGKLTQGEIHRIDYAQDLQIAPRPDPKMASEKQKLTKAEMIYRAAMENPLIASSPPHIYEATLNYFRALDVENPQRYVPQPMQGMGRVDDPMLENMTALYPMPQVPPPHPSQNHLEHAKAHQMFLSDPQYGMRVRPEGSQALQDHMQMHIAYLYGLTEAEEGLNGPSGIASLAPAPGNTGIPQGPPGGVPAGPMEGGDGAARVLSPPGPAGGYRPNGAPNQPGTR